MGNNLIAHNENVPKKMSPSIFKGVVFLNWHAFPNAYTTKNMTITAKICGLPFSRIRAKKIIALNACLGSSRPFKRYIKIHGINAITRSEEHTSELQSQSNLVC